MNTIFKHAICIVALAAASVLTPAPAAAQDAVSLDSEVQVAKDVDGVTTYVAPEQVFPGDRLKFVTRYDNGGAEPAEDFVITNPLPGAVSLAEDGDFLVSVDGGESFGRLSGRTVAAEDGTQRPAELSDVTHVRWIIPSIAPGESGEAIFFAQVK